MSLDIHTFLHTLTPVISEAKVRKDGQFLLVIRKEPGPLRFVHILNRTAELIYNVCDGKTNVASIIEFMLQKYPKVSEKRIRGDVYKYLWQMERRGILTNRLIAKNVKGNQASGKK